MKKQLLFLLSFSLILQVAIIGQVNNGLKAYYPFSGDAIDLSGKNNGILIGKPVLTTDRFGMKDCAYLFPGDALNYIRVNYDSVFDVSPQGAFSIILWYQGGSAATADYEQLFQKGDPSNTNNFGYSLALYDINQVVFGNGLQGLWSRNVNFQFPDTNWYNIVAIYENKNWYLYKNTVLVDSDTSRKYDIQKANNNISIGKKFAGKIDDIRFYDRALNTSEIGQIYKLSSSCQVTSNADFHTKSTINIYPNPSDSKFTLQLKESSENINISVYNLTGAELLKYNFNGDNIVIDLSSYQNGFYLVKIQYNGITEKRMIEKK